MLGYAVRHFLRRVVHDPGVVVVQRHIGVVIVGVVPFGFGALQGDGAHRGRFVNVVGHVDPPETVRRDIAFQLMVRAEALLQHLLESREALLPGDLERNQGRVQGDFFLLLLHHHGAAAVAAESRRGGIQRADLRAAGRAGHQVDGEGAPGRPGFLFVRLPDRHGPVAPAAFQSLGRDVKHHLRPASGTTVHRQTPPL